MVWKITNNNLEVSQLKELIELCKKTPIDIMFKFHFKGESQNVIFLYHILCLLSVEDNFFNEIEECVMYERSN